MIDRMNILLMLLSLSMTGAVMFFIIYALRPLLERYFPQRTLYALYIAVLLRLLVPYSPEFSLMQRAYDAVSESAVWSVEGTAGAAPSGDVSSIAGTADAAHPGSAAPANGQTEKTGGTSGNSSPPENGSHSSAPSAAAGEEKADGRKKILSLITMISLIVWAAGAAALMLKTFAGYFVFLGRVKERQTEYIVPAETARRLGKLPPVVRDSGSCSPMVIGLLRPRIILPEREYAPERLYCVLLHERTHYMCGDIIVKWLCELACCLYWFSPVMMLLRRELSDACETSCDEKAVSDMDTNERKAYVGTLLATAVEGAAAYDSMRLAPTMTAGGRRFRERLKKNMTYKKPNALTRALSALLVCAFISGGILLGGCIGSGDAAIGSEDAAVGGNMSEDTMPDMPQGYAEPAPAEDVYSYDNDSVPGFLYGYPDIGRYRNPTVLPGTGGTGDAYGTRLSEDGTLEFPGASVLAVVISGYGDAPRLMEQDDAVITELFELVKSAAVSTESEENVWTRPSEQDAEISAVLVTGDGRYRLVTLRSFKDGYINIRIESEGADEPLVLSADSPAIHSGMRQACGVKSGDSSCLAQAVSVSYLNKDGEWVTLPEDRTAELRTLKDSLTRIKNGSAGCPFDLKAVIRTNEGSYDVKIGTDSCGVIIIEDETYQLEAGKREAFRVVFPDAFWDGGGWDGTLYGY